MSTNVKVVVRVRPPIQRELDDKLKPYVNSIKSSPPGNITILETAAATFGHVSDDIDPATVLSSQQFTFDNVFDQNSTQAQIFDTTLIDALNSLIEGYNVTVMAYGQTSSGKTYTMEGSPTDPGLIRRSIEYIFNLAQQSQDSYSFKLSYLEIYNEHITDLLSTQIKDLRLGERNEGVFVDGLSEHEVNNTDEVLGLLSKGQKQRVVAETKMNHSSSRSHAVFSFIITRQQRNGMLTKSKLNLVDLAGSERIKDTGATGLRLQESTAINKSLSTLGNVIAKLVQRASHIPYRDSKLTRLLQDSLGGNAKTILFANVTPSPKSYSESLSTLQFANRAKKIKNAAKINGAADVNAQLVFYESEVKRLTEENAQIDDLKSRISDLEAELAAKSQNIKVIEQRSIPRGKALFDTEEFQQAVSEEIEKIRAQYQARLKELESDSAMPVDSSKYRELLKKQREIMQNLTSRLTSNHQNLQEKETEIATLRQQLSFTNNSLASITILANSLQQRVSGVTLIKNGSVTEEGEALIRTSLNHSQPILVQSPICDKLMRGEGSQSELDDLQKEKKELLREIEVLQTNNANLNNLLKNRVQELLEEELTKRLSAVGAEDISALKATNIKLTKENNQLKKEMEKNGLLSTPVVKGILK